MIVGIRQERLEFELQALSESGYEYEIVSGAPDSPEELHLKVILLHHGAGIPLDVHFPVLYPYFRFQVAAPSLALPHHQNPLRSNLCLLGRGTRNWSLRFTLADFLTTQVPLAIEAGSATDPADVQDIEDIQAEPVSNYYPAHPNSLIGIDGSWQVPTDIGSGFVTLGYQEDPPRAPNRAVILQVADTSGNVLVEAHPKLRERFRFRRTGFWARLDDPPPTEDAALFLAKVAEANGQKGTKGRQGARGGSFRFGFAIFPEEHSWRDEASGDGWLSIFEWRRTVRGSERAKDVSAEAYFVRVLRMGQSDFHKRIPAAAPIWDKKIVVVGVGCVGAPIAHFLAQAGVGRLCLVDSDAVDPATTVRWPLGAPYWGVAKVEALGAFLSQNFPYTSVDGAALAVGSVRLSDSTEELEVLEGVLADAALVVDATAEHGVQRFLSVITREREIPYVWASGTWGGWGGMVGRVSPDDDACWCCVELAIARGAVPPPAADPGGAFQPAGCGDVTFTGVGFDMQEVSLQACRVAVGALRQSDDDYPRSAENCFTLGIHDQHGPNALPQWHSQEVEQDPGCPVCGHG